MHTTTTPAPLTRVFGNIAVKDSARIKTSIPWWEIKTTINKKVSIHVWVRGDNPCGLSRMQNIICELLAPVMPVPEGTGDAKEDVRPVRLSHFQQVDGLGSYSNPSGTPEHPVEAANFELDERFAELIFGRLAILLEFPGNGEILSRLAMSSEEYGHILFASRLAAKKS